MDPVESMSRAELEAIRDRDTDGAESLVAFIICTCAFIIIQVFAQASDMLRGAGAGQRVLLGLLLGGVPMLPIWFVVSMMVSDRYYKPVSAARNELARRDSHTAAHGSTPTRTSEPSNASEQDSDFAELEDGALKPRTGKAARAVDRALSAGVGVFGTTASGAAATVAGFGAARVAAGRIGEEAVARVLDKLAHENDPLTFCVFHDLRRPSASTANIDHLVLCGDRVIVVDAKNWKGGQYTRDIELHAYRDEERFRPGDSMGVLESVEDIRAYLLQRAHAAHVDGLVAVRSSDGVPVDLSSFDGVAGVEHCSLPDLERRLVQIVEDSVRPDPAEWCRLARSLYKLVRDKAK